MSEPYLSEIRMMAFTFAPRGWALCNGQTLAINQYQALFSLLGTTYGGNGITTFNLPNLQGAVPLHFGTAPSGGTYVLGETGGEAGHTLTTAEIAQHMHGMRAKAATASTDAAGVTPSPSVALAQAVASQAGGGTLAVSIYGTSAATLVMAPNAIGMEGGSQPHENRQPFGVVNFCIALSGIFPSRS